MDYLSTIRKPTEGEMNNFVELFKQSLSQGDGMLESVLSHIRQRGGKRMRPMLILLTAKNYGEVSSVTQNAALGLELLHTASLVHDDVVDESDQRRGQPSVNAEYNNKVAVLVGDYILSTALLHVSYTNNQRIVQELSELGRTLAAGEIVNHYCSWENNYLQGDWTTCWFIFAGFALVIGVSFALVFHPEKK